jgi:hypothetical protein
MFGLFCFVLAASWPRLVSSICGELFMLTRRITIRAVRHLALEKDAPLHRAVQRSGVIVAIPILAGRLVSHSQVLVLRRLSVRADQNLASGPWQSA